MYKNRTNVRLLLKFFQNMHDSIDSNVIIYVMSSPVQLFELYLRTARSVKSLFHGRAPSCRRRSLRGPSVLAAMTQMHP